MIIHPSILTRSLVNRPAYSQAYINRPFQTLGTTLGSHLFGRAAQKKGLPLLPELLGRAAQVPGPGQELSTPFSHVNAAQTSASRWKHPCQSQQPFLVQNHGLRVRHPQASHTHRRLGRKRRRNRSSAIYRPAKRSPPRGRWCDL